MQIVEMSRKTITKPILKNAVDHSTILTQVCSIHTKRSTYRWSNRYSRNDTHVNIELESEQVMLKVITVWYRVKSVRNIRIEQNKAKTIEEESIKLACSHKINYRKICLNNIFSYKMYFYEQAPLPYAYCNCNLVSPDMKIKNTVLLVRNGIILLKQHVTMGLSNGACC